MRTFVGAVLASGLLFGHSIDARAQSMDDERAATRAHIAAHGRGSILARAAVLDSPFSGDAVTTWRPPSGSGRHEVTGTARFYRDSAGRVRVEQPLLGSGSNHRQRIVVEFELTITSRDEPPAALFEIPADYDVGKPANGASSLNPYATEAWPKLSSSFKSSCGSAKPPGF